MSDIQIGSQENRPQDLPQTEAKIDAVIDTAVKHNMGDMSKFMGMMKGGERGFDLTTEMFSAKTGSVFAGAMQVHDEVASTGADFASGMGRGRRKGAQTLNQMLSTTDALGHKRSRAEMQSRFATVNAAWSGHNRGTKYSDTNSKDFIEEINLLKQRMAFLPVALKANKSMLPGYGLGFIYEAHVAVQREKEAPATNAIISGTMNDMDKYKDGFKQLDDSLKDKLASNAGAEVEKKLAPLKSHADKPKAPGAAA
ncbi:MAG: hypothetical protein PW788_11275 [Micavibrio sp.]|nr:hypothetical protein [Micavibrio sp.]